METEGEGEGERRESDRRKRLREENIASWRMERSRMSLSKTQLKLERACWFERRVKIEAEPGLGPSRCFKCALVT